MSNNIFDDKRRGYHSTECGDSEPQVERASADAEQGAGCWSLWMLMLTVLTLLALFARR